MVFEYRGVEVYYKFVNRKKDITNIFLHGWGVDHTTLEFFDQSLREENSLFVDFPPFGKSGKNLNKWTIFTYVNMLISLCHKLSIKKFNIIGHSFGGRVAIVMSAICKEETNKLVLFDSAGVKPRRGLRYRFKVLSYKIKKHLGCDTSKCGSEDYKKLDKNMKEVFANIVNTHLDEFMPVVRCKTLIVFGENDVETPTYMAMKIHKKIKRSELVLLKGAGHFCFLDQPFECSALLKNFVEVK